MPVCGKDTVVNRGLEIIVAFDYCFLIVFLDQKCIFNLLLFICLEKSYLLPEPSERQVFVSFLRSDHSL